MISVTVNARFLTQRITGVQRVAIELCQQFKRIDPDIRFVAPRNIVHADLARTLGAETFGSFTGHAWEQFDLPRFLRRSRNPLLLNLANTAPLFYDQNILTLHDLAVFRNPRWFSRGFRTYYRFMIPRLTQKARHVLTVSEFSRREILDLLKPNPEKVTVVPNAVSTTIARLANEVTENRYGRYVLAVSSLDPRKNFSTILDAFARLPKSDCQLVLVGSESVIFIDPGLKKQIEQIPNAVFTGYLGDRELVALYRHAICLVYPSIYEGFGLPPIEAMACGCPVIVSRTTSLPEVCGNAALYCDPYDPQDWADKISEIIGNPTLSNDLRLRGFSQIRRYSWEKSAQSILDVVKRLTAG